MSRLLRARLLACLLRATRLAFSCGSSSPAGVASCSTVTLREPPGEASTTSRVSLPSFSTGFPGVRVQCGPPPPPPPISSCRRGKPFSSDSLSSVMFAGATLPPRAAPQRAKQFQAVLPPRTAPRAATERSTKVTDTERWLECPQRKWPTTDPFLLSLQQARPRVFSDPLGSLSNTGPRNTPQTPHMTHNATPSRL